MLDHFNKLIIIFACVNHVFHKLLPSKPMDHISIVSVSSIAWSIMSINSNVLFKTAYPSAYFLNTAHA